MQPPRPQIRPAPGSGRRHALVGLLAAAALAGPLRAAEPGIGAKEIVVGQSVTLRGGKDAYGAAVAEGARIYVEAVNAAGGVNGRKVVLRVMDDDNKATTADANARKLVQDGAFVLFGSVEGGPSTAVMKAAAELNVPFFGPMAGPPNLRRPHQPMVFPVRAEHREEFRALLNYGKTIGLRSVGFFHADTDVGRQHVENVRRIAGELGLELVVLNPFKPELDDAGLDAIVKGIAEKRPDFYVNHGAAGLYEKLIRKAREAGLRTTFMGVNSGSFQIAKGLGPLAHGMVFSQVVPSPWERKRELTREYQETVRRAAPDVEFSYGGMEGFMTAKALVKALQLAGPEPTRASFVKGLENARFDLGGVSVRYAPGDHEGSRFIDLSLVRADGRFQH